MAGLLHQIDIPVMIRRATMDVPEMMAGGPREVLVPSDRELEARAMLDPSEPIRAEDVEGLR